MKNYFSSKDCQGDVFQNEVTVFARNRLIDLFRSQKRAQDFKEIYTPAFMKNEVWKKTGHYSFYSDNMFFIDENCALKPMSCPGATLFVKETYKKSTSIKEFPIKIFEFGRVYRKELSGVGQMMRRLNVFTQDDSHVFCIDVDSCKSVISQMLDDAIFFYKNILKCEDIKVSLSTKPKNSIDDTEKWSQASDIIKEIVFQRGIYNVQEEEGAFYGPKIDMMVNGIQLFTCQLDFFLSEKLNLYFTKSNDEENKKFFPIVVHSATMGSIERFLSILMDDIKLPFWCIDNAFIIIKTSNEDVKSNNLVNFFEENNVKYVIETDARLAMKKWQSNRRYFLFCGSQEDDDSIVLRIDNQQSIININTFKNDIKDNIIAVRRFFNYDSSI